MRLSLFAFATLPIGTLAELTSQQKHGRALVRRADVNGKRNTPQTNGPQNAPARTEETKKEETTTNSNNEVNNEPSVSPKPGPTTKNPSTKNPTTKNPTTENATPSTEAAPAPVNQDQNTPPDAEEEKAGANCHKEDQYAENQGQYSVRNNVWNHNADPHGSQCISVVKNGFTALFNWGGQPWDTKSFPSIRFTPNRKWNSITAMSLTADWAYHGRNIAGNFALDMQFSQGGKKWEGMIWFQTLYPQGHPIGPLGKATTSGKYGRLPYQLFMGKNTVTNQLCTSIVFHGGITKWDGKIKGLIDDIVKAASIPGDANVDYIDVGFEVFTGSGTASLRNFALTVG